MSGGRDAIVYTDGGVGPAGFGAAAAVSNMGGIRKKLVAFLGEVSIHDAEIFAGLLGIALVTGENPALIRWCCDSTACEATARGSDVSPISSVVRGAAGNAPIEIVAPDKSPNPKLHRSCHRACVWAYEKHPRLLEGPIGLIGERNPSNAWLYLNLRAEWRMLTLDWLQARIAGVRAELPRPG